MAKPPAVSPLTYIINRQYDERLPVKSALFRERLSAAKNLYRKDLFAHYGCVNAIEFSDEGELLVSGGDDRRVLLWSVAEAIHGKSNPISMQTNHFSNIFCLAFNSTNSKIFSGGNDDQVIVHDIRTGQLVVVLSHKKPVYGLSVNPQNDHVLATAGDDGRILIYDIRDTDPLCLAKYKLGFHSVMYNPLNPALLVTANSEDGIALWDARKPKECLIHYDKEASDISGISACFNSTGSQILALRRRLPPVLYATENRNAMCQFYHPHYYNSCTMKTCSFAGENDEYILSGSDDFNLYMWKVPQDKAEWGQSHVVLRGHRSIVNQVRYNKQNNLIASSGVEKMIKLWSTLHIGTWQGSLKKDYSESQRIVFSHDDYIYLVGHTGHRISHDYSDHSTREDSRMMAFFDSLIQREIEAWESQSEATFTSDSDSDTLVQERIRLSWQSLLRCRKNAEDCASKKHKPNRIAQLIAQKRNRLAKMAHWKSSTLVQRNSGREKHKKRKNNFKKFKSKLGKGNGNLRKPGGKRPRPSSPAVSTSEKENHSGSKYEVERMRFKKYRTRQSVREFDSQNQSIDVPSTSTGITGSSNPVFRVIEQDSDEEAPSNNPSCTEPRAPDNLINILPTPLNGSQDMYINVLEVSNGNSTNVVAVRNQEYASTSAASNSFENYASSLSDSDFELTTPAKQPRQADCGEVDSGFATGPCSSAGFSRQRAAIQKNPCDSSDDEYKYERFRKRVKKARLNIRKQIGVDSDSN